MRAAGVILLAAAAVAAAGCGGGSKPSSQVKLSPTAYVAQAAKQSAQATSEHVVMKGSTAVQSQTLVLSGSGDFDNAKKLGSLTAHVNVQGVDMEIDEIVSGATVYMRSDLFAAQLPAGKTWLKLDLQRLGKSEGIDFSSLTGQTPEQGFSQLEASGSVQAVGDETIDGVATTRYRGRIDLSKLPQGAKIEAVTGATYGPYDVWIDKDDGYVRRLTMTYSTTKPKAVSVSTTMSFSDFGKDVVVDVPSSDDAVDMTDESIKGLGG